MPFRLTVKACINPSQYYCVLLAVRGLCAEELGWKLVISDARVVAISANVIIQATIEG